MTPEAAAVLEFWFDSPPAETLEAARAKMRRWYMGGAEMDRAIAARFSGLVERALAGELDGWASEPLSRLALILTCDQFPRGLFRDTPRGFAGDARALRLTLAALDAGEDATLNTEQRMFLLMPLLHAEDRAAQERGVAEMRRLHADVPAHLRPIYAGGIEQSEKYHAVIARFGRFPHRNEILGRASTPEELEFLRDWKERQPPAVSRQA